MSTIAINAFREPGHGDQWTGCQRCSSTIRRLRNGVGLRQTIVVSSGGKRRTGQRRRIRLRKRTSDSYVRRQSGSAVVFVFISVAVIQLSVFMPHDFDLSAVAQPSGVRSLNTHTHKHTHHACGLHSIGIYWLFAIYIACKQFNNTRNIRRYSMIQCRKGYCTVV